MNGSAIYKKPIAIIMAVLAFIGAAISLLFINHGLFGLISTELEGNIATISGKICEALPGGISLIPVIFGGVIVLISILGLTGNNGKLGFLFTLLAGIVFTASNLFGGTAPMVKIEAVAKIFEDYGEYVNYAIYGLLLLGAVFFAISIGSSKEELEYSGFTVLLPVIYLVIAFVGYAAIVILPKVLTSFTLSEDIIKYAILGVVGLSVLLTLIGVHSNTASRGANAWLLFAAVMIVVLLNVALIALEKFVPADKPLDLHKDVVEAIVPVIAFFPLMGYAISDLRN